MRAIQASLRSWRLVRSSGFFGEREPGTFQIPHELGLAGAPGRVPHLAANGIERLGLPGHDVERIETQRRSSSAAADDPLDPLRAVGGYELDRLPAKVAQFVEEALERRLAPALGGPHQARRVMIDDDRDVALARRWLIWPIPRWRNEASRSRPTWASATTRVMIAPTVRQAHRRSSVTALLLVCTVSQATVSCKARVCPAP